MAAGPDRIETSDYTKIHRRLYGTINRNLGKDEIKVGLVSSYTWSGHLDGPGHSFYYSSKL